MLSEVFRADEATFFGAEEKDDVVVVGVLTLAVVADRFEQKRGARTVVVGPVVDGWGTFVQAVFAAHTDVVVVGTKDDCARLVIVNESGEVVSRAVALFHAYGEAHFLGFLGQFSAAASLRTKSTGMSMELMALKNSGTSEAVFSGLIRSTAAAPLALASLSRWFTLW